MLVIAPGRDTKPPANEPRSCYLLMLRRRENANGLCIRRTLCPALHCRSIVRPKRWLVRRGRNSDAQQSFQENPAARPSPFSMIARTATRLRAGDSTQSGTVSRSTARGLFPGDSPELAVDDGWPVAPRLHAGECRIVQFGIAAGHVDAWIDHSPFNGYGEFHGGFSASTIDDGVRRIITGALVRTPEDSGRTHRRGRCIRLALHGDRIRRRCLPMVRRQQAINGRCDCGLRAACRGRDPQTVICPCVIIALRLGWSTMGFIAVPAIKSLRHHFAARTRYFPSSGCNRRGKTQCLVGAICAGPVPTTRLAMHFRHPPP